MVIQLSGNGKLHVEKSPSQKVSKSNSLQVDKLEPCKIFEVSLSDIVQGLKSWVVRIPSRHQLGGAGGDFPLAAEPRNIYSKYPIQNVPRVQSTEIFWFPLGDFECIWRLILVLWIIKFTNHCIIKWVFFGAVGRGFRLSCSICFGVCQ